MPAPRNLWRHTYFFETEQAALNGVPGYSAGWTENIYTDNTNQDIEAQLAYAATTLWLSLRRACLASTVTITWVRVNRVGVRASKVANLFTLGGSTTPPAQVTCAALAIFTAPPPGAAPDNASHRRAYLLRGLPAAFMNGDVANEGSATWANYLRWLKFMSNGTQDSVNIPGLNAPGIPNIVIPYDNPNSVYQPITATVVARRSFSITSALGPATLVDKVRIKGVGNPRQLNGLWSLQNASPGPQYVLGRARRDIQGDWDNTGQAKLVQVWQAPIKNWVFTGMRTKRVGRPFRLPVGRRRRA